MRLFVPEFSAALPARLDPHPVYAAMVRTFLKRMAMTEDQAPVFQSDLKRHILLDQGFHAPLSLRLSTALCGEDQEKVAKARAAANQAVEARVEFWDDVLAALPGSINKTAKQEAACLN